jgi:hypothetical protein
MRAYAPLLACVALIGCDDTVDPGPKQAPPPAPSLARSPQVMSANVANQGAAGQCPPMAFRTGINLAANPSFEAGPGPKAWPPGPVPAPSAAAGWFMHTSNNQDRVTSILVPTNVPGNGQNLMLSFTAGGNEGGIYQLIPGSPARVMFSAWVKVTRGQVVIGANAMVNQTPYSWSTKLNEWEQLRICTDGTFPTDYFYIYNAAATGGAFFVDRVEVKEIS